MWTKMIDGHQVQTNGVTVWVNSGVDTHCLARFTKHSFEVVSVKGETEGAPGSGEGEVPETTNTDWGRFCRSIKRHHDVTLPDDLRPNRLKEEIKTT